MATSIGRHSPTHRRRGRLMHIAFVTPRYGQAIVGGAEAAVRSYATRIALKGHKVEVITSTSTTLEWDDTIPATTSLEDGVIVHRLPPLHPRLPHFSASYAKALATGRFYDRGTADQFLLDQGPVLSGFAELLDRLNPDRVVSYPLLYWPNLQALIWNPRRSVLHPAAHPEAILSSSIYSDAVPLARRIVFQTKAEQELLNRLFQIGTSRQLVLPLGLGEQLASGVTQTSSSTHASDAYLLALGRVQADKGSNILTELYRHTKPSMNLIMAGPIIEEPQVPKGVELLGEIADSDRNMLLKNARAVVIASRYESFSLVALEAMGAGVPLIVNGFNQVLLEQIERSGAGVAFRSASELLGAIELFGGDPELARSLGQRGRAYAEANSKWETIIDRYLAFLR
ncbi:glycosyltransferase family 4 protein [Ferrimicrobium acidiphilum]|uniref:glycosyltransferase family 4 protein n=2 Tax=Ferrimicrobium acidiphilum TaxID=121039 RepID=UPI0023F0B868|nr:glycosyltransferase family 4 protein [Ferrimicrobium acidiphilum]